MIPQGCASWFHYVQPLVILMPRIIDVAEHLPVSGKLWGDA